MNGAWKELSRWKRALPIFGLACMSTLARNEEEVPKDAPTGQGWKRRLYFHYEKRIRRDSAPDKVYAYFASEKDADGKEKMTIQDLARSVLPVFQPTGSSSIRSGSLPGEPMIGTKNSDTSDLVRTFDLDGDGLVSFREYLVFSALYKMDRKDCERFFQRYDANGDGKLSRMEFERMVKEIMEDGNLYRRGFGMRTGMKEDVPGPPETALTRFVYREETDPSGITLVQFQRFLQSLHDDITRAEFDHYDYDKKGWICGMDFARSIVAAASITSIDTYLKRIPRMPQHLLDARIEFHHFYSIRALQEKLAEGTIEIDLSGGCNREHFLAKMRSCTEVDLPTEVVDIVFHLFDANGDGILCCKEFQGLFAKKPR